MRAANTIALRIPAASALLAVILAMHACLADDAPLDDPPVAAAIDWSGEIMKSAEQMLVFASAEAEQPLQMLAAYKWYNAARAQDVPGQRLLLLYVHDGCPVASCKIYPAGKTIVHTLISLTDQPLVARKDDAAIWTPPKSAPNYTLLADAKPPGKDSGQRRVQLKSLAREFSMVTGNGEAKRQSSEPELRLLPQPLYRYEIQDDGQDGLVDGAAFCFVANGGNPQALLLIEAVREEGEMSWRYGFSRRTFAQLKAFRRQKEAWSVPFLPLRKQRSTDAFFKLDVPLTGAATSETVRP